MYLPYFRRNGSNGSSTIVSASIPEFSLELAGIVALAELTTVSERTLLTGASSILDTLVVCPGLHREHWAQELNKGEYPATANLVSDYVFRVENPGTVYFLQRVGRTGHLTVLKVSAEKPETWLSILFPIHIATPMSAAAHALCIVLTITTLVLMGLSQDWWGVLVIGILVLGRLLNFGILRRRARQGWKGAEEPGVEGDLIVLLSQDRWVRIRGAVDDLKAITSGQWLRDMTSFDKMVVGVSTMLVYLDAALASNLKMLGKILLIVLLVATAGLLEISNAATNKMFMHGRVLEVVGHPKPYDRRLSLAKQLIDEYGGKSSWAIKTGMVNEEDLRSMNDSRDTTQASVTCRDVADAHGVVQAEEEGGPDLTPRKQATLGEVIM